MADPATLAAVGVAAGVGAAAVSKHGDDTQNALLQAILDQLVAANKYASAERERTLYPVTLYRDIPNSINRGTYNFPSPVRLALMLGYNSAAMTNEMALVQGTARLFKFIGNQLPIDFQSAPIRLAGEVTIDDLSTENDDFDITLLVYDEPNIGIAYRP